MIDFVKQFRLKYDMGYEEEIICITLHLLNTTGQIFIQK